MDSPDSPDSPAARVERTFWSIWYYITGAVNRFLRPEPTNIDNNGPDTIQESAVDAESASCDHAERDAGREEVDEEQHLSTASQLGPSRSAVAWDLCTTEIDLGPNEESMQYEAQLNTGSNSKASEEGGGTREEQVTQTGNDAADWLVNKDALQHVPDAREDWKSHSRVQDEIHDACEGSVTTTLLRLRGDAMSDDAEEGGAEEENERSLIPGDHQKMDETVTKIQVNEEDYKMHPEEQHWEEEHTEVKLCALVDLSPEETGKMHIEEGTTQRGEADTAAAHEEVESSDRVSQWACEIENRTDVGAKQDENQTSVCERSDDHTDFHGGPSSTSLHAELQMPCDNSGIVSEDELVRVGDDHVPAHRSESDEAEDAGEKEHESTVDESEQGAAVVEEENVSEAANKLRTAEALEQEDNVKTVTEDTEEEEEEGGEEEEGEEEVEVEEEEEEEDDDISTQNAAFSEEVQRTDEPELHTAEVIDGKEEGVAKDAEEQTKTREMGDVEPETYSKVTDEESDVTATDVSVDERFFDKDQVEEEKLSCGAGNNESNMEITSTATSVTVKPEGETGQEITGEFKNMPPGGSEGRRVVLQELNSPTCEETQEGVPEYNNERGPDENTTQRFLEDGDYKEIQATQLPEEVESRELESLQNGACEAGADYLIVREEEDGAEDIESSSDLVVEDHTQLVQEPEDPLVETVIQEAGLLLEEEEGKSLIESMKTGTDQLEEESDISLTDDTDDATKEMQDGTERVVVEFEKDESLCGSDERDAGGVSEDVVADETLKSLEVKEQKVTETSFFQESIEAIKNTSTASIQEDFAGSGLLKELDEPKVLEEQEKQDVEVDMEERIYGVEEEAGEEETNNKNETEILNLQLTDVPAEQITESALTEETELSRATESDEALEIRKEEILPDTETAEESVTTKESIPTHLAGSDESCSKDTLGSVSGRQDVIDEEILDLWIQTALSEDADDIKQERPELEQQTDTNKEPSDEEGDENSSVQTEKEKETLMDSGELLSDTEVSSLTAESGFLDQSLSEEGPHNSECQLLESTSSESFQGINDTLADMSESEVSAQDPNRESQDLLEEETTETEQSYLTEEVSIAEVGFHPDSGITSSDQESQRKTDDERGSQTESDDEATDTTNKSDTEEEEDESQTEMSAAFEVEETKAEDERLESVTVSESPDEIKPAESGRSRSESEASSEEGTESGSRDDTFTESEESLKTLPSVNTPQCEDVTDSSPELSEAEVEEQLMFYDHMEVDASLLDSTVQRSRISVKNPRVRPPKDPRSLLHKPSVDPTPSSRLPVKVPAGVPMGGLGIGIKLPGLGAGFPVLKKTPRPVRDENSPDNVSQEPETKPEEQSDTPKQEEAPHKPKWMPPKHPGFGNPLMSELKNKLKKTTQE